MDHLIQYCWVGKHKSHLRYETVKNNQSLGASKARYKKIHTKIPLNTSCLKKIREFFGQKSGRFWPTLLLEIHVVQKNSQIKRTIAERFSGKKVAIFGQYSYQKYMSFKKIHR